MPNISHMLESPWLHASDCPGEDRVLTIQGKQQTSGSAALPALPADVVILLDISGSMAEWAGPQRKIDHMRSALAGIWGEVPNGRLIAFSSGVRMLADPSEIPEPSGKTALHLALEAAQVYAPIRTVIITDGRPDNEAATIAAAEALAGTIDILYVGEWTFGAALHFLERLAALGGGRLTWHDLGSSTPGNDFARDLAVHVGPRLDDRPDEPPHGPESRAKIDQRARILVAVRRIYLSLAKAHHSDVGGTDAEMKMVNVMRDDLVRTIERGSGWTKSRAVDAVVEIYVRLNAAQPPLTEIQVVALNRFKTQLVREINQRTPRKRKKEMASPVGSTTS